MAINRRTLIPIVGLVLLVFAKLLHAQPRGYSLRSDRVEISSSAHWQAWSSPADMVEVDPVGAIRSRFVRGPYNALSDASQFSHIIANNARGQYDLSLIHI